jgi:hypothetical protein
MARGVLSIPVALSPLYLGGCVPTPPPVDPTVQIPPVPSTPPAPPASSPAAAAKVRGDATAGLRPLATPQQVIQSVTLGRADPFGRLLPSLPVLVGPDGQPLAATPGAAAGRRGTPAPRTTGDSLPPPPLQLPRNFSLSGVISSRGISEAVVSYGDLSGSLRPGDRGGRTTDLLPPGWSVAAIDVPRGVLTLQRGRQTVRAEL